MKKRILVVNGSPHREKSSTMVITDCFVKGMLECGDYEAETVHVSSLNVKPCLGCLSCWGRSEGECVINTDDVYELKNKVIKADVVIISFPLYVFGIPGQLKMLLDRLLPLMNTYRGQYVPKDGAPAHGPRYNKPGQKFILISGCAYVETEEVYDPVLKQSDLIFGKGNYTAILCPQLKTMIDNGGGRVERTKERFVMAGAEYAETLSLCENTLKAITRPPFSHEVYKTILSNVWAKEIEKGRKGEISEP
ncbi:MAG: flavodoxin family protein [Eubacteriales bacterium]|nr:flavodoxin family protein [Eubacteriales bacterium]